MDPINCKTKLDWQIGIVHEVLEQRKVGENSAGRANKELWEENLDELEEKQTQSESENLNVDMRNLDLSPLLCEENIDFNTEEGNEEKNNNKNKIENKKDNKMYISTGGGQEENIFGGSSSNIIEEVVSPPVQPFSSLDAFDDENPFNSVNLDMGRPNYI